MNRNRTHRAGVIASILLVSIAAQMAPAQEEGETRAMITSGNIAHDVMQALVVLGELDSVSADPTSSLARQAITNAERRMGMPADGIADRALFDRLNTEVSKKDSSQVSEGGFTLEDGATLTAIITGIGGLVLGFLKLRRNNRTSAAGPV